MIRKTLLQLIYEAAYMQRWNDHMRPKGFTELDKQAHKMVLAYILGKFEETDRKAVIDWTALIDGALFELLHRIMLTDIKPPIFHKLMAYKGEQLNKWVLDKLEESGIYDVNGNLRDKMKLYFFDPEYHPLEKKILKASHYLATNWEFQIIYSLNPRLYGIDVTKAEIENELEEHIDLAGVQKLQMGKKTQNFIDFVGQLRFQLRWAQTARIPETSVMGHMLIVAYLSHLCSLELNACDKRIYNNFFAGLFHDLPEVLTRDIVSPVKRSVEGLDALIKEIEKLQVEEKILPLLPLSWHDEIRYFVEDEFQSRIIQNDKVRNVHSAEICKTYNSNEFSPIDGEIIEACDKLAAYIEAFLSMSHGIKSHNLMEGHELLYSKYKNKIVAGIDFGQFFDYFKLENLL
ncbi:MAG: HD domain-containing protein [Bacillota bacterium]|nr:HD domain-containing protein [Bacillota bacterium]